MEQYRFIAIEGNIGAGKTSLSTKISEDFNRKLILEQFADNPFLPKFYKDPKHYSFPLELSFLAERYSQLKTDLTDTDIFQPNIVSDYLFNKSLLFAKVNLEPDEHDLYSKLFNIITTMLPKPDLFVYLYNDVTNLKKNIQSRGRSYEQEIKYEYLEEIQQGYFDFMKQKQDELRILIVNTKNLDFVNSKKDYNFLINTISKQYPKGITRV